MMSKAGSTARGVKARTEALVLHGEFAMQRARNYGLVGARSIYAGRDVSVPSHSGTSTTHVPRRSRVAEARARERNPRPNRTSSSQTGSVAALFTPSPAERRRSARRGTLLAPSGAVNSLAGH